MKKEEVPAGYTFVGNTRTGNIPAECVGLNYIIGEQAVDIHGSPLAREYMRPLYIHNLDLQRYNANMQP